MSAARDRLGAMRVRKRRRGPLIGYATAVTALKILLPGIAIGLILLVALWPQYLLEGGRFQIVPNSEGQGGIDRLSMINPHFRGSDSRNRPFTLTAERATQDQSDDNLMHLARPQAQMTLEDGAGVELKAAEGFYRRDLELLRLAGGVDLLHDRGYEIRTSSAAIDLKAGTARGDEPVAATGPFGELQSEGFRVLDRGDRIEFTGKSRLVLQDGAGDLP
jgi:lipopolysaccharide export system protein LptC